MIRSSRKKRLIFLHKTGFLAFESEKNSIFDLEILNFWQRHFKINSGNYIMPSGVSLSCYHVPIKLEMEITEKAWSSMIPGYV